jgi:hypothetical protein
MKHDITIRLILAGLISVCVPGHGQPGGLAAAWSAAGIGITEGRQQFADGKFSVTAGGKGMFWPFEQAQFVYKNIVAGGDFKIVARACSTSRAAHSTERCPCVHGGQENGRRVRKRNSGIRINADER